MGRAQRHRPRLSLFTTVLLAAQFSPIRAGEFRFTDVSNAAGLTQKVLAGRPGKDHLLDSAGNGLAWIDFDRDGLIDLYVVNAWRLEGSQIVEKGANALYRNRGDGSFEDVSARAGVADSAHWGSGVAVADYDSDGWPDLLVTNFGPNVLFRNRGDGTFENLAANAGIESPGWNTGAAFFDADQDGDLDLYIAAYIEASMDEVLKARPTLDWKGLAKVAVGPFGLQGAQDHFFLNEGSGRFREATSEFGLVDRSRGFGFAVRAADFDDDGDMDLYVANDSDANFFYRNQGGGKFEEIGLWNGSGLSGNGAAQAGMGATAGDFDGDGVLDLFVTNFAEDFSTLYRGLGDGFFEDVSVPSGVGPLTYQPLSWGTVFADLDNDGDLDLVVANGHIYPQVDEHPAAGQSFNQSLQLLENDGRGRFTDATAEAGLSSLTPSSYRGLAAGDFDNDGDLDLAVSRLDAPPLLLRNDSPPGGWLVIECVPTPGKGPVLGTRVKISAAGRPQLRDISSSDSYLSSHDSRVHFGLAEAKAVDQLEIRWPNGETTTFRNVPARQFLKVPHP